MGYSLRMFRVYPEKNLVKHLLLWCNIMFTFSVIIKSVIILPQTKVLNSIFFVHLNF